MGMENKFLKMEIFSKGNMLMANLVGKVYLKLYRHLYLG